MPSQQGLKPNLIRLGNCPDQVKMIFRPYAPDAHAMCTYGPQS